MYQALQSKNRCYGTEILLIQRDYLGMVPVFPDMPTSVILAQFPRKHFFYCSGSVCSYCSEDSG